MLPRSPTFSHNHGQTKLNDAVSRRHIPNDFSQQQWVETQLNVTNSNFRGNNLNGFPVISTTYQWAPRHYIPPSNPNRLRPGNRKRGGDRQDQYDLKKQRISSPGPYDRPIKGTGSSPAPRPGAGTSRREEARSDLFPPMRLPIAHKPVGYVPFLREESHPNARYSLPLSSVKDKLSHQILELFLACEQRSDDLEKKELCRAHLQTDIQSLFPTAQVFLAGSSLNGFGTRSSDADLCLVIQEGPVNQKTDAVYILSLVQKLLYKLSYIERPRLIRAKVPILKFRDKVSGVEFDLNVNNVVGIRNTFLLRTYAYIEKRVRPIILVIKKWASHHGINDASRGTLSSYTLVLMVLHYLQTLPEPVIPCLQMDYPECFSPTMDIHLVPTGPRNIPPYVSKNQSSLGDLFLGFLKYYAAVFRWDKLVISVREAKVLPKPSCKEWRDKFICVEEPFDGSNTARAVHEKVKFDVIKEQFMESWQILQLRKDLNFILPTKETKPKR